MTSVSEFILMKLIIIYDTLPVNTQKEAQSLLYSALLISPLFSKAFMVGNPPHGNRC